MNSAPIAKNFGTSTLPSKNYTSSPTASMHSERIISSLADLKTFPNLESGKNAPTKDNLAHYFSTGGIIRLKTNTGQEPVMVYPTQERLKLLLETKVNLRANYQKKMSHWKQKLTQAQNYNAVNELKKFSSPIYWKHLAQYVGNKRYRQHADAVQLPVALLNDPRYRPMVKMFVNDPDYRKQLAETVQESVAYSKNRKVAHFAEHLQEFRKEECTRNIKTLQVKIKALDKDIDTFQALMKWSLF